VKIKALVVKIRRGRTSHEVLVFREISRGITEYVNFPPPVSDEMCFSLFPSLSGCIVNAAYVLESERRTGSATTTRRRRRRGSAVKGGESKE